MSRIVIDARIISASTGRYVERLLSYLQEIDRQNQYIILVLKKDLTYWRPSAPNFKVMEANFPLYSLREQFHFALQLYRLKADLVHFTMPNHPLLYFKKHILTVHDLTLVTHINRRRESFLKDLFKNEAKPRLFRLLMRVSLPLAQHIITPTNYVRSEVLRRYGIEPARISYTLEAAEKLAAESSEPPHAAQKPFILYVGNAYPYKNLERLVEAIHEVNRTHPITLVLAGKPDYFYEQLKTYVTKAYIGNVRFAGFVSDAELAWLYEHAKLYVFPSLSEGFGLSPLEAMTYGLPVAAARASCLPEVLQDAAVYFDPLDKRSMAKVVSETLADTEKLAELKKAGLRHVRSFSWARMAEQTHTIYSSVLKQS